MAASGARQRTSSLVEGPNVSERLREILNDSRIGLACALITLSLFDSPQSKVEMFVSLQLAPFLYNVYNLTFIIQAEMKSPLWSEKRPPGTSWSRKFSIAPITQRCGVQRLEKCFFACFDLLEGPQKSARSKTRRPVTLSSWERGAQSHTRSAFGWHVRSILAFCSCTSARLEGVRLSRGGHG